MTITAERVNPLLGSDDRSNPLYPTTNTMAIAFRSIASEYQIKAKVLQYRMDPALWAWERIGVMLWSIQQQVAESVRDNPKTVVKSCHSSGKTYLAAVLACWWIDTHPPEETRVVTTAPTTFQVNKLLWEYIRKIHRNNGLTGKVTEQAEWKSTDRDVIGIGRKPADTDVHGFQGSHATYVLAIIDEACGVPQQIWTAVEAITTGEENRIMAIGNPDDPATEFGRIFIRDDKSWTKFTISAFDTPNFTGEAEKMPPIIRTNLLSVRWVEEKKSSWGVESARYRAKILAEFPPTSDENFFSPMLLMSCLDIDPYTLIRDDGRKIFGCDYARFGSDKTTVILNHCGVIEVIDSWQGLDTYDSAERIHALAVRHDVTEIRGDDTGVGAGVNDQLIRLGEAQYYVIKMVGSAASPDFRQWYNARAFWHDNVREKMKRGEIALPEFLGGDDAESDPKTLFEELEGLRYKFSPKQGSILIESKDDMRRRNIKSPDFSDALMYATADLDLFISPTSALAPGDVVNVDPYDLMAELGWGGISPV